MPLSETDKKRLKEIAIELKKIRKLFGEYHCWKDNETQNILFPPGRYFNYDETVEKECELLIERISIKNRRRVPKSDATIVRYQQKACEHANTSECEQFRYGTADTVGFPLPLHRKC